LYVEVYLREVTASKNRVEYILYIITTVCYYRDDEIPFCLRYVRFNVNIQHSNKYDSRREYFKIHATVWYELFDATHLRRLWVPSINDTSRHKRQSILGIKWV